MIQVLFLCLIAPTSVFLGLIVFKNILITFILFYGVVCLFVPVTDIMIIRQQGLRDFVDALGFKNIKKTVLPATGLGLFFCLFIFLFFVLLQKHILNIDLVQSALDEWQIHKKSVIPFIFTMVVANSIFEEVYWRGYIYYKLSSRYTPVHVIGLTAFFYASYHPISILNLFSLDYAILFSLIIFSIGVFWGYMRYRLDSIYFPIISHMLADLGIMLMYFKYFGK